MIDSSDDHPGPLIDGEPTLDRFFGAFGHVQRRHILRRLNEDDRRDEAELSVDDLPTTEDAPELSSVALNHKHLPALADNGYIDWAREAHTVTHGKNFGEVDPFLELHHHHTDETPTGQP